MSKKKELPYDADLEADVMRVILHHPASIYAVMQYSEDPSFFYAADLRLLWRAAVDLAKGGQAVDPAIVRSKVVGERWMKADEADDVIERLLRVHEMPDHIDDWSQRLHAIYADRETLKLSREIESVYAVRGGDAVREYVSQRLVELRGTRASTTLMKAGNDVFEDAKVHRKKRILRRGLMTGIPGLDRATNGIGDNWFVVVGADSGTGKTAFALEIAANVAASGKNVWVGSFEMTPDLLARRHYANRTGLPYDRIVTYDFSDEEWEVFEERNQKMEAYAERMRIVTQEDVSGKLDAEKVFAMVHAAHSRTPIDLVVLDYFQLFCGKETGDKEEASKAINRISKQLRIPVILLSQFNRDRSRTSRAPNRSDLKGTTQLENDADIILLMDPLYKRIEPERWASEDVYEGMIEFIFDKHRHGAPTPTSDFNMQYRGECYSFAAPPPPTSAPTIKSSPISEWLSNRAA